MNGSAILMKDLDTPFRAGPFCVFVLFVAELTVVSFELGLTEAEAPCETSASDNGGNVWESNPPSV